MPRRTNKSFDPSNYSPVYEEALQCKETRKVFKDYLKTSHGEEAILFIEALERYSANYEKAVKEVGGWNDDTTLRVDDSKGLRKAVKLLYGAADEIIRTFVQVGSPKELNLGSAQRLTLDLWKNISMEEDGNYRESVSSSESNGCSEVFVAIKPDLLFKQVYFMVNMDLKLDQFPRFARSEMLRSFLREKGEDFTRGIAIDISKGFEVDLRFKPHDLVHNTIDDNHIYFGLTLAEDTPDWELVLDEPNLQTFVSKTRYTFDKGSMKGLQLAKAVITLPFRIDDVWASLWNTDTLGQIDPMAFKIRRACKYCAPNDNSKYGLSMGINGVKMFPIKRALCFTATAVQDAEIGCYVLTAHTSDFTEEDFYEKKQEDKDLQGLFYFLLFKINEKSTRLVIPTYCDVDFPFVSGFLYKTLAKKRSKMIREAIVSVLNEITEHGSKVADTSSFKDGMYIKQSCMDNTLTQPNRSWYREWLSLKQIKGNKH